MKFILLLIYISVLSASELESVGYDWCDHFGYVNRNGSLMWNRDWYSGSYFFDGTWSNNPGLMGPEIKDGFFYQSIDTIQYDSSIVKSYFDYTQGDYLQDEFSAVLNYIGNDSKIGINGFKRSFAGRFNQYTPPNRFPEPIHQTYTLQYKFKKDLEEIDVAVGHFNTYSGLPDTMGKSLYNSRITTNNITWKKSFRSYSAEIIGNNFLQRMISDYRYPDSLSNFFESYKNLRYLTRSQYSGVLKWKKSENLDLFSSIVLHSRSVRMDALRNEHWQQLLIGIKANNFYLSGGLVNTLLERKPLINISFFFNSNDFFTKLYFERQPLPIHPFFKSPGLLTSNSLIGITGKINKEHWILSVTANHVNYVSNLAIDKTEDIYPNNESNLSFSSELDILLIDSFHLMFGFIGQQGKSLISDGVKRKLKLAGRWDFKIFKGIMNLETDLELNGWFGREQAGFILPVEAVPASLNYNSLSENIWFINASIRAVVSSFTISYTWNNLSEIILNASGSKRENSIKIHPLMPVLGHQSSMTVTWKFLD